MKPVYNRVKWSLLRLRRYPLSFLQPVKEKPIIGLDTETLHGDVKLIMASDGRKLWANGINSVLSFLTIKPLRSSLNFFYNLSYDADSILKELPPENVDDIVKTGQTIYGAYSIRYIPRKVLKIGLNRHVCVFYDIFQFYGGKLETNAALYLKRRKLTETIDRVRLGNEAEYWTGRRDEITRYCRRDCDLTAGLARLLLSEIMARLDITPKSFTSKAAVSKQYFRRVCSVPDTTKIPRGALRYAFESYHGGRFEVTTRGYIGTATVLDINSAYPAVIRDLLDVTRGKWRAVREMNKKADYGFYLVLITIPYMRLPPLAYQLKNTVIYPYGTWAAWLTKNEIIAALKVGKVRVITGFEFTASERVYPFREAVNRLYEAKRRAKKETYEYELYKKVANALYGCFYEKWRTPDGYLQTGALFNPVYASIITADTRLKLWREAQRHGKRAVSMATDGLILTGRGTFDLTDELGAFSFRDEGDTVILRSGIYSVGDELKQRGVMKRKDIITPYGKFKTIFEYVRARPELSEYPITIKRPVHLTETILHHRRFTIGDTNVWKDFETSFSLITEIKRIYNPKVITGGDLLTKKYEGEPYYIDLLREKSGGRDSLPRP